MADIEIGRPYSVKCPFVRSTYDGIDEDGFTKTATWKPGIDWEIQGCSESYSSVPVCDGWGTVTYTVVSIHSLPRPYPPRVFFTRHWEAPNGHKFGKNRLHIMTTGQFKRRLARYQPGGVSEYDEIELRQRAPNALAKATGDRT